jgi:hypothetical protein
LSDLIVTEYWSSRKDSSTMSDRVTFGDIDTLLKALGFQRGRVEGKPYIVFDHQPSGVVFMFRPYKANHRFGSHDLLSVRLHLVHNGLMTDAAFDRQLNKLMKTRADKAKKK